MSTEKEKRTYNKGGKLSRIEPQQITDIMQSPYIIMLFEEIGCFAFCQKIQEVGFNVKLTSVFATLFKENEIIIVGVKFMDLLNSLLLPPGYLFRGGFGSKGLILT